MFIKFAKNWFPNGTIEKRNRKMSDFTFRISPNIVLGSYTTTRLGSFASEYGSKYILVADPILKESGNLEKITQSLKDNNVEFFIFDDLSKSVDSQVLSRALALSKESHIHGVIGAGGGKTLSLARMLAAVFNNESQDLYSVFDSCESKSEPLPLIALPTTMREAFVFTDKVPIVDARTSKLKIIKVPSNLSKLVIFDPNIVSTLSDNQLESMTIETLCLATESYISQKANFFSDMIAEKAIELLSLANAEEDSSVTTPKEELVVQGGCMASLAVSLTSLGTASLLSLCVNPKQKISRSLVTSVLFPYVIEDCSKYKVAKLAKIARILKTCADDASDEDAAQSFATYVRQRIAKANLPARLKDLGLTIEQMALASEDAAKLDFINTLPRSMTSDDLFALIKTAY